MRAAVVVVVLAGCRSLLGIDDPIQIDAAAIDAPSAGMACLGNPAVLQVCVPTPQADVMLHNQILFTQAAAGQPDSCDFLQAYGGSNGSGSDELCIVTGNVMTIDSVSVDDVAGKRPIVFVATESIYVENVLDGGSHQHNNNLVGPGANLGVCPVVDGGHGSGGGGGGAGGSFGTLGGNGGDGIAGAGGVAAGVALPTTLAAGCNGGAGKPGTAFNANGGNAGGVVYLISPTIQIDGVIDVSGEGGNGGAAVAGGGGGGTGGMCGLDASTMLTIGGAVIANGGGGGGGGGESGSAALTGSIGSDGGTVQAAGGPGRLGGAAGGDGAFATGAGGAGSSVTGLGSGQGGGGGGGGGGLGVVLLAGSGSVTGMANISAVVVTR